MGFRFDVNTPEEFEELLEVRDLRISEALVETILNNLKGKKRHIHALSIFCREDGAIYDVTVDRKDFHHTLKENLPVYEREEKYEDCIRIQKALKHLENKKKKNG
jgi:hypothetical protein